MILLISQYKYPEGDAGSVRMHNLALTLKQMGQDVFVIGLGKIQKEVDYYKGIPYVSLRVKNKYNSRFLFNYRLYRQISKLRKKYTIKNIILGTSSIDVIMFLKFICSKYQIHLIKDVVEWYSASQFRYRKYAFPYLAKEIENKRLITKKMAVISISSFLHTYFTQKGIQSVRIPVYMDQNEFPDYSKNYSNKLVLIYAGSPGKKDYLSVMLKALALLPTDLLKKIQFNVIGLTPAQIELIFQDDFSIFSKIKDNIKAYGRLPRAAVVEKLKEADFSVLLRSEKERYAKAGFPTKVIESISVSVPVIMNFTSDLGLYFTDRKNCIQVENDTIGKFREALIKAVSLSPEDKKELAQNAKSLAERCFNTTSYAKELERIIQK